MVALETVAVRVVASWHQEETLGNPQLTQSQTERTLYRMARLSTTMMTNNQGVVGDVARSVGGNPVTPPVDPSDIKSHFGDLKGSPQIAELLTNMSGGVAVVTAPSKIDLTAALRHGNHPSEVGNFRSRAWGRMGGSRGCTV